MLSLEERMKSYYENRNQTYLIRRMPVLMRLDGRAFHTYTKNFEKPFDERLNASLVGSAVDLLKEIQGAKCAYIQSDETSILITDYDKLETEAWFDYNVQKMVSVASSIFSVNFCLFGGISQTIILPTFDCRAWNIPREDVENYFLWRQQDWNRNSLTMVARTYYSHKELDNKKTPEMHEMLYSKGQNWANYPDRWKNGVFIYKEDGEWIDTRKTKCPRFNELKAREIIRGMVNCDENN